MIWREEKTWLCGWNNRTKRTVGGLVPQWVGGRGYKRVTLLVDGKGCKKPVHRLIAEAFLGEPENVELYEIHHKDQDKVNNCVENLVWENRKDHFARHLPAFRKAIVEHQTGETNTMAKLKEEQVLEIDRRLQNKEKQRDIAKDFEISEQNLSDIKYGRNWGWLTGR